MLSSVSKFTINRHSAFLDEDELARRIATGVANGWRRCSSPLAPTRGRGRTGGSLRSRRIKELVIPCRTATQTDK
jgi:hypothetical protein